MAVIDSVMCSALSTWCDDRVIPEVEFKHLRIALEEHFLCKSNIN